MSRLPISLLGTIVVCAGFASAAEPGPWQPVQLPPEAAGSDLRGIFFLDDRHGWIVGDKGLCLATSDGGTTWENRDTGSDATLRCVRFTDARNGFACGDGDSRAPKATGHIVMGRPLKQGTLLATSDGGRTWKSAWVPCNFEIWCVEASTAARIQVGIGLDAHLDGDITRSDDGGATWSERRVYRSLADIRAVNATRWVAVGSPVSVDLLGEIRDPAYLAQECRALYSDDAGKTWNVSQGSDGPAVLRSLLVRRGLPLLAVGDAGTIVASDDDGQNWRPLAVPARIQLRGIAADAAAEQPATVIAVGDRGAFLFSPDAGRTWRGSTTGTERMLHAVAACGSRFIAVGAGGTAVACTAAALAAARDLPPLPPPQVDASVQAEPIPKATPEQRALVRVGDSTLVTYTMRGTIGATVGMNSEWQVKQSITAVKDDTCTVVTEIVKGKPPAGMMPVRKYEEEVPIATMSEAAPELEVGQTVKEEHVDPEDKTTVKITRTREPDETLEVNGVKLTCMVITTIYEMPGLEKSESKEWYGPELMSLVRVVKSENTQPTQLPVGAAVTRFTQSLTEWTRGPE